MAAAAFGSSPSSTWSPRAARDLVRGPRSDDLERVSVGRRGRASRSESTGTLASSGCPGVVHQLDEQIVVAAARLHNAFDTTVEFEHRMRVLGRGADLN